MPVTLSDRKRLGQKKAKLEEGIARLKERERKARVSHLIWLGGLVEKAGLATLDSDALYDELVALERRIAKRGQTATRDRLLTASAPPGDSPAPDDASSEADTRPLHVVSQAG